MRRPSGQIIYISGLALACVLGVVYLLLPESSHTPVEAQQPRSALRLEQIPFDGAAALKNLQQLCALGPRPSGSRGMTQQQELLTKHFEALGAKVVRQEFNARHPLDGTNVKLANLIVEWHPDRQQRVLVLAHYDTRPWPDRDPRDPRGTFVGANDGASGAALMMELGRHMAKLDGQRGVDFLLVDGEEFVFNERTDAYFLGSTYFAQQYVASPPPHRYQQGVLLDMVGDADLQLFYERNSMQLAPSVARQIWDTARRLGVREFIPQIRHEANDDHVPLNRIAKIPTADVIDFDYPYWHTQQDMAARCSALSLAKVGWVISEWLKTVAK